MKKTSLAKFLKNRKDALLITFLYLATRLPFLGVDIINIDAPAWNYRAKNFYIYLKQFDFPNTYRSYHPGVTLMWLSGFGIELYSQIYKFFNGLRPSYFDSSIFPFEHFSAKAPLVLATLTAILIAYRALKILFDRRLAFLFILLFIFEPFFVANTRVLHLDALMTVFMLDSLLFILLYAWRGENKRHLFLSSFFASLAVLSKIPSIFIVLFNPLILGLIFLHGFFSIKSVQGVVQGRFLWLKKETPKLVKNIFLFVSFCALFSYLIFPASWSRPVKVAQKIYKDGVSKTGGGEQGQFFLGRQVGDPGTLFYVLTLIYRSSPLLLAFFILGFFFFFRKIKNGKVLETREGKFFIVSVLFILLFGAQMSIATKKIDRYILPLFPFTAYIASYGIYSFIKSVKKTKRLFLYKSALVLVAVQFVFSSARIFPDYFLYYNGVLGGLGRAYRIFGPMDWGAGYQRVAKYINNSERDFDKSNVITAAYNDGSLDPLMKGRVVQIDMAEGNFDKVDFIVVPNGDIYGKEALKKGFVLEKVVKIDGFPYWYIYSNTDLSRKEFDI